MYSKNYKQSLVRERYQEMVIKLGNSSCREIINRFPQRLGVELVLLNALVDDFAQSRAIVLIFADDLKLGNVCRIKEDGYSAGKME